MKERQPYEKHLADKLQQLPPPADMNQSWEKMRLLLDDEMPRGGGFGRNRWWIGGLILLLLLSGTWLTGTLLSKDKPPAVAATPNPANTNPANPTNPGLPNAAEKDQQKTGTTTGDTKTVVPGNAVDNKSAEDKPVIKTGSANDPAVKTDKEQSLVTTVGKKEKPATSIAKKEPVKITVTPKENPVKEETVVAGNNSRPNNRGATTNTRKNNSDVANTNYRGRKSSTNNSINKPNEERNAGNTTLIKKDILKQEKPLNPFTGNYLVDNTTINSPSGAINERYDPFTGAELFPELANKKAAKSKSSYSGKVMTGRTFAFGLSLPLGFPLGDQKAFSYNRNAGPNTVSDYIPSPNVQYHFNSKTYIQTEFQLYTPQFIRPILLYQDWQASGADRIYNSVYARKLYYFNLPVAIHHSPFKNFYLGTGLQFSTMLSGVAQYEQVKRGPNMQDILLKESFTRFSNDSLSNRFNGSEMRLLLDMNYYFNRFTVGLRYNQAVNNYVSFRVNNTLPYTYDKNKALQFYLRYNLWEDIKRKKPARSLLTLK